jgi:hypothetical protein
MLNWITISDIRLALDQVPVGAEEDAKLQWAGEAAEATIARFLTGVVIALPAPADLKQITVELTSSIYLTRGTSSLLETVGAEGQGGFTYIGQLNDRQKNALRQLRIEAGAVAV